ncbi:MAG: metallophosphoesterase [Beijerinckiaceae bacterium]|nr:metallophosphoesterase [Beijerinckiaceae bacterium]
MISRRTFLTSLSSFVVGSMVLGGYAFGIEPVYRLRVQRYALTPPGWTPGLKLRIAALSDIHANEPFMPLPRIREIVDATNALQPDLIVLLGDYVFGHKLQLRKIANAEWAAEFARLRAPLGVHAILGNHEWWEDRKDPRAGALAARTALEAVGIPVMENDAVRLAKDGRPFWLLGLGDQLSFQMQRHGYGGVDDLPATLARVTDDAPVVLLAHEPDIFVDVPSRVALTLSGHTHGGQIRLFGWSPVTPSIYGNRFAYGHVVEGGRNLIVSGGLGTSQVPVRLGVPPEIVLAELG